MNLQELNKKYRNNTGIIRITQELQEKYKNCKNNITIARTIEEYILKVSKFGRLKA